MAKNTIVLQWGRPIYKQPAAVVMRQQGRERFSVTYGLQFNADLTYAEAAREFGECCMHFAACEGLLDNREKGGRYYEAARTFLPNDDDTYDNEDTGVVRRGSWTCRRLPRRRTR
jgi:hypothetical protein